MESSVDALIGDLQNRHTRLEAEISEEDQRPRPDRDVLVRLKVRKLYLKDKIEQLKEHAVG